MSARIWIPGLVVVVLAVVLGVGAWRMVRPPSPPPIAAAPPKPLVEESPPETKPSREHAVVWAIVIGIDQYQDEAIPPCRGAVADARAVAWWFQETAGWGDRQVLLLDDLGERYPPLAAPVDRALHLQPSRVNLDWAVSEWLASRLQPDDVVVVYFAGQAVALPPLSGEAPHVPSAEFLLPIDARASRPDRTGWALDEALDAVASTGRNPVVCWLDTSLLGRGRRVDEAPPGFQPTATRFLQKLTRWPGTAAWLAADGQTAQEAEAVGQRSAFTGALLDALGRPERSNNLLACLDRLNRDPSLTAQGFRALGGLNPSLTLWSKDMEHRAASERQLLLQRGHASGVTCIAFTADGQQMATAGLDATVKLWRVSDRLLLRSWPDPMVSVTSLALSPNGRFLASGDGSGRLRLWDLAEHREVPTGPAHESGIDQVVFLPDSLQFVSLDLNGQAWWWTVAQTDRGGRELSVQATGLAVASASEAARLRVALAQADGKITLFDENGAQVEVLDGPEGFVTSPRLATDGRLLIVADDTGILQVWDASTRETIHQQRFNSPINWVSLSPSGLLAVGLDSSIALVSLDRDHPGRRLANLATEAPTNEACFSNGARWFAARTFDGHLLVWDLGDRDRMEPIRLDEEDQNGRATTLAFSPDGRTIVSGDQDGGLRFWDLPRGEARARILPRRGQIAALSVSDDGRYLLQVSQDREAQVWDLQEGRALSSLPGRWTSGVLAPDGTRAFLIDHETGDVALVDRASGRRLPAEFHRPPTAGEPARFGVLAVSGDPDGRLVAAGSVDHPFEGPLVCVWDSETGALLHAIQDHLDPHPLTAVAFSADATRLLTASEDGTVRVYDLTAAADGDDAVTTPPLVQSWTMSDEHGDPIAITAARFHPTDGDRVVTGSLDGRVRLWDVGRDRPTAEVGRVEGAVGAVTFSRDGRWLAAAGDLEKSVRLWALDAGRPQPVRLDPSPHHDERINALVAWPHNLLIASGSDDTTVKLWHLADATLLGTLSAEQGTTDWVAYTPDGLFDSSVGGERQVTWLDQNEVRPLDQYFEHSYVFRLTDQLRQGRRPDPPTPPSEPPPRLSIDRPVEAVSDQREVRLTLSLGETGLDDIRLYHDGVPVLSDVDLPLAADQRRVAVPIRLRSGVNRFYAMASKPGAIDGRSNVVELRYDGPEPPGRLHVLALGVSRYDDPERALQFADRDASRLSAYLHQQGLADGGEPGLRRVLVNDEVTEANVEAAFVELRDRVASRPEDTIVVFLAGHADVLFQRFHLLLSGFRFGEVGPRDFDPTTVLPYTAIYRNIARLGALQRLIIIDACQAEAIADDPGVRQVRETIDRGAHQAKTAHLLAARRGEPAHEAAALEHGLMTFVLLKGLGHPDLEALPDLAIFEDHPVADRDGDGLITTGELSWFTDITLPKLAASFPALVQRTGADGRPIAVRPEAHLRQRPHVQASDVSFPLVTLPTARTPDADTPQDAAARPADGASPPLVAR